MSSCRATNAKALREAQTYVRGATVVGRLGGALIAPLPWWASGAPWWAVPIFVIVLGWFCGAVYGGYVFRKVSHVLNAFYPELKL